MFKRGSKITSLLVAAASVISITTGVNAEAAARLETKEGKFDSAVAYSGKYIYDGYKNNDDSSIYVSDNKNDNEVKDADDYSGYNVKYGEKYVIASDNGEDYLVDLSNGKIDSSSSTKDKKEDAANALKRNIKSTDRYGRYVSVSDSDLELIGENKFGNVWYKYSITPGSDAESITNVTEDGKLVGFADADGNYVDASNLTGMSVLSGGKTVKVEEFGKESNGVTVTLKSLDVITQDSSNIYALTEVKVAGGNTAGAEENQTYIQKISKSKGSTKDGAYVPKTVNSYILTSVFDGSDDDKAANLIDASSISSSDNYYFVKEGNLYLAKKSSETKITVTKFSMKKEKIALDGTSNKLDVYVTKVDDDETHDIKSGSNISLDVDGNLWGINKAKVFKMSGLTASDVYTCDSDMTNIDVYNEKNLVLWNSSSEIYTALVNGAAASDNGDSNGDNNGDNNGGNNGDNNGGNNGGNNGDNNGGSNGSGNNGGGSTLVPSGWTKQGNNWYFLYSDGTKRTGWYYELGNWYYFYGNGQMATAFIDLGGGAVYYLNPNADGNQGKMLTGWQKINGYWYYFNPVSDSFGYEGMMQRGWRNIGGVWYYFYYDGTMAANTRINGYYVNASGAWVPGR